MMSFKHELAQKAAKKRAKREAKELIQDYDKQKKYMSETLQKSAPTSDKQGVLESVEILIYGFVKDVFASPVPTEIKYIVCKFYQLMMIIIKMDQV